MTFQSVLEDLRIEAGPAYLEEIEAAAQHLVRSGVPHRGKQVGDQAPDFALTAPDGLHVVLSELLRTGPVVLTFYRGEWCPFCEAELAALLAEQPAMARLGASLLLISPEPASDRLVSNVERLGPKARLLRDVNLGVALQYGLVYLVPDRLRQFYLGRNFDLSRELSTASWLLPFPADFVIDPNGTIALSYIVPDFNQRLDPKILVETLTPRRGLP
jgi:peroxiredoxin